MAFLNKNITIRVRDERADEKSEKELHYEGGIIAFVEYMNRNKEVLHAKPIYFEGRKGDSIIEVAMQYNNTYAENIFSFANNIATTEGGMHLTGLKTAITKVFIDYAKKYGIIKDNDKAALMGEDVREGLTAVISVKIKTPSLRARQKPNSVTARCEVLWSIRREKLSDFLEENPTVTEPFWINMMAARAGKRPERQEN